MRLLLRKAVEGAEAPDKLAAIDGDNLAVGEAALKDVLRLGVSGIRKRGKQDSAVRNVKVGVTGRQP